MESHLKTEDFYNWFKSVGGNLVSMNPEKVNHNINYIRLEFSSTLKTDPARIKAMYNHKFKSALWQK